MISHLRPNDRQQLGLHSEQQLHVQVAHDSAAAMRPSAPFTNPAGSVQTDAVHSKGPAIKVRLQLSDVQKSSCPMCLLVTRDAIFTQFNMPKTWISPYKRKVRLGNKGGDTTRRPKAEIRRQFQGGALQIRRTSL
ncbi:hypothetical protein ACLOJK_029289 [Asimina triloba]